MKMQGQKGKCKVDIEINNANSHHFKASSDLITDLENVSNFLLIETLRTGLKLIANDIGFSLRNKKINRFKHVCNKKKSN